MKCDLRILCAGLHHQVPARLRIDELFARKTWQVDERRRPLRGETVGSADLDFTWVSRRAKSDVEVAAGM
jgi:hypothetical protein